MTAVSLVLGLCLAPMPAAQAFDAGCPDAATTAEMLECVEALHAAAEREMSAAYEALAGALAPEPRAALEASQRAWLAFREAHNALFAVAPTGGDGTMAALVRTAELVELTEARTAQLEELLVWVDG
jgi:uncharacterized protein YecT (DUF1311 family)